MKINKIINLVNIISKLRSKDGCPWDKELDLKSLSKLTLEECYELIDSIEENDPTKIVDELSDLLTHLLFYVNIGESNKMFDIDDVIDNAHKKLISRHPHVFDKENFGILGSAEEVKDNWDSIKNKEVDEVIKNLKEKKFIYEGKIKAPEGENNENWVEREQLLFKSTEFGDDKDRALQKEDKSWTYFASDVAYHNTKLKRNFDVLVNILGADHAGYIKRITSVVEALSGKKNKLICKVSQLVKLIKDKKPFKMSKRKGDYITIEDLINEVGKDATRFIMLSRSSDAEIDFDFDKVKEKSKENPIYYVQYAYARISSVFRNTQHEIKSDIKITNSEYKFGDQEIKLFKKISEWPKCVEVSTEKLEPHRISVYLYELASEFHSYWNMGKDDISKRFIEEDNSIKEEKLVFLKSIANTIKSGMDILGVDTPEKM